MEKQRTGNGPAGDIRLELNEINQMQQADTKDSMELAGFTDTSGGGAFTIFCC